MARAIVLRSDFSAIALRRLARQSKDAAQARRVLALAAIYYDGGTCSEAARLGNVTLEIVRDNWLSNRIFRDHDDIVAHCCQAWNRLVDQLWCILSLGMRDWARRF